MFESGALCQQEVYLDPSQLFSSPYLRHQTSSVQRPIICDGKIGKSFDNNLQVPIEKHENEVYKMINEWMSIF